MVLSRATTDEGAGADGVLEDDPGTAAGERDGAPAATGELLTNRDTLVTIGANSIFLIGVDGTGTNIITQQDFILA